VAAEYVANQPGVGVPGDQVDFAIAEIVLVGLANYLGGRRKAIHL
jgi:hypothetical protein